MNSVSPKAKTLNVFFRKPSFFQNCSPVMRKTQMAITLTKQSLQNDLSYQALAYEALAYEAQALSCLRPQKGFSPKRLKP